MDLKSIVSEIAKRKDTNPDRGKKEYGDVPFADEKNKKYPIDKEHIHAALAYWGKAKNRAKYSAEDQKTIGGRIHAAARKFGVKISDDKKDSQEASGSHIHHYMTTTDKGHNHTAQVDENGDGETDMAYYNPKKKGSNDEQEPDADDMPPDRYATGYSAGMEGHFHTINGWKVKPSTDDGHTHRLLSTVAVETVLTESIQESVGAKGNGYDRFTLTVREAIRSASGQPEAYHVSLIKAGLSVNRNFYTPDVLKESLPLLNESQMKAYIDHSKALVASRPPQEIAGGFKNYRWTEATQTLDADFIPTNPWLAEAMARANAADLNHLYQLSIDAAVAYVVENHTDGKPFRRVLQMAKYNSTDVVDNASAGGRVNGRVVTEEIKNMTPDELRNAIKADPTLKAVVKEMFGPEDRNVPEPNRVPGSTDDVPEKDYSVPPDDFKGRDPSHTYTHVDESKKPKVDIPVEKPTAASGGSAKADRVEELSRKVRVAENREIRRALLAESKLPPFYAEQVSNILQEDIGRDENDEFEKRGKRLIESFRTLAAAEEQKKISQTQNGAKVIMGFQCEAQVDKISKAVDGYFAGSDVDGVKRYSSLQKMYFELTDDRTFKGRLGESALLRLVEAADTNTFQKILGDSITRRIQYDFKTARVTWKNVVSNYRESIDFRVQRTDVLGGYPGLSTVAQGGTYTAIATPGDVEVTFNITKYGNTETITEELIRNDDRGDLVRRMPRRLALSAAHQLDQYVWKTLLTNNPTYGGDSNAVFSSAHANQGTAVLSQPALDAGRAAMRKQKPYGQTIVFSDITPKYLVVPPDLEVLAYSLVYQTISVVAPGDQTNYKGVNVHALANMEIIVLPFLSSQSTKNWYLVADPKEVETIEMGFLDGIQEPQIYTQDMPNVGSWFTNDQLTWKIKFPYGGVLQEWRSFYRGNPDNLA